MRQTGWAHKIKTPLHSVRSVHDRSPNNLVGQAHADTVTGDEQMQLKLEAQIAGGIALYDVSAQLPMHASKRPRQRAVPTIQRVYVHHSGKLGRPGLAGAQASARYAVGTLGWATIGYHFWCPWEPVYDDEQRLVVFRCAPDAWITNHTMGCNGHGIGVVLQGNTGTDGLSRSQVEILEALLPWLRERHGLASEWLSWHSESGRFGGKNPKSSCPGREAEAWLRAYRRGLGESYSDTEGA